jgi:hypothetical protein
MTPHLSMPLLITTTEHVVQTRILQTCSFETKAER